MMQKPELRAGATTGSACAVTAQSNAVPSLTPMRTVLRWTLGVTRPVHAPLYFSIVMRVIELSLNVILFGLLAWAILVYFTQLDPALLALNRISPAADPGFLFAADRISFGGLLVAIVAIGLLKAVCYYAEQFSGHFVAFKALELLRGKAFASLWPKSPGIVKATKSGDLVASLTRDIDRIEVLYAHTLAPVVAGILVPIILGVGGAIAFGWQIVAPAFGCALISAFVVPVIGFGSSLEATSAVLRTRRKLTQHVTDSVFGAEEVVGYAREAERIAKMNELSVEIRSASEKPSKYRAFRRAANMALNYGSMLLTLIVGINSEYHYGVIAFVMGACLTLFEAPRGLEDAVGALDHSLAAARRLYDICHIPARVQGGTRCALGATSMGVRWEKVSYSYPDARNTDVLHDFSASVPAGTHAMFVAPSGSGKSTAVQLLLRYDDPNSGTVYLGDHPVGEYTLDSLRRAVALVPQRPELLNASIRQNLLLAAPDASDDQLWEALALAHIDAEVRAMPAGIDTPAGTEGSGLSGGQMQRICLARALLTQPRVLVLDEFTANVNLELEEEIRASLAKARPHLTIIEITHMAHRHQDADQLIYL